MSASTSLSATQASSTSSPSMASTTQPDSGSTTESATVQASSSKDNKLGVGEIIGIVVGILALIVAIITLIVNWKSLKPKLHLTVSVPPSASPPMS